MSGEIDDPGQVWMKAEVSNMMKMESVFHSDSGASASRAEEKNISQHLLQRLMLVLCMFNLLQCSSIELYGVNHRATVQHNAR